MPDFDPRDAHQGRDGLHRRLREVQRTITEACDRAGRSPSEVTLVAVSKTHPVEALEALYEAGVRDFGESYVQELLDKWDVLPGDIRWHFIGRLQSNKARFIADRIGLVHSVDRKSVMKQLHRRSHEQVDVLLQVNVSREATKGGVEPEELLALLERALDYPDLRVRGLMGMAPYADDPEESRPYFRRLRELFDQARGRLAEVAPERGDAFNELSMGMTNDFAVAIEEGATLVRVGTAIFGERDYAA